MTTARMRTLLTACLALCAASPAAAGSPPDPLHQAECGSCHVAYPARLLPAASWRKLLAGLSAHFGTDASLDAESAAAIEKYLTAGARAPRRAERADPPLRITETTWFRHEHDEVPRAWWQSAAVRGPADCGACHGKADRGTFGERDIRRPR